METLTQEQKATNFETRRHISQVRALLNDIVLCLLRRGDNHDATKLESPEVEGFVEYTPMLAKAQYDSPEYQEALKGLAPVLAHHYAHSRHHTEHFKNGINDMNLVDLVEMFADWKAATLRQKDGNLRKSIEINANNYGISPQLVKIFENSIELFDK